MDALYEIRAASLADVPQIARLVERYWDFEGIEGFKPAKIEALLWQLLSDPHLGMVWVVQSGTELIGYLIAVLVFSLEHQGMTAEIDELFIVPEARSHGIGGKLLSAAEAALARAGCVSVQLQLGIHNDSARAFYERHGYTARDGYELLDKTLK